MSGLTQHYGFALGVTDGTTSFCSAAISQDNVDTSDATRGMRNKAICGVLWGEVTLVEADLTSWDATNVTIDWTTQMGTAGVYINYIAIGGSEVRAKVVNWQAPTVTGNRAVTGFGFKPDVVIHGYSGSALTTAPPFNQTSAHFGMGAMTSAGNQWANMVRTIDGAGTTETNRGQQTDAAIYMFGAGVGLLKEASFVSMNTGRLHRQLLDDRRRCQPDLFARPQRREREGWQLQQGDRRGRSDGCRCPVHAGRCAAEQLSKCRARRPRHSCPLWDWRVGRDE